MARERSLRGDVDLRAFYAAGHTVRTGHARQLYDSATESRTQQTIFSGGGRTLPFLYPAFAALPFAPLSLLSYRAAFGVVLACNLGCLFACAWMFSVHARFGELSTTWIFGLFLAFFPTSIAFMQGQISCPLLLVFTAFHLLTQQGKSFLAGLCLSLALVKFQFALPLVFIYLVGRQFKVVFGFLAGASLLGGISLLLCGPAGMRNYFDRLHGVSSTMLLAPAEAHARYGMQTSTEPNLHGLFSLIAGTATTGIVLTLACSLAILVLALLSPPAIETALPAAMLVSYHMQPYDLVLLLLPLGLLLANPARSAFKLQPNGQRLALLSAACLTLPIAPCLLTSGLIAFCSLAVLGTMLASYHLQAARDTGMFP